MTGERLPEPGCLFFAGLSHQWGRHGFDGDACGQEACRGAHTRNRVQNDNCQSTERIRTLIREAAVLRSFARGLRANVTQRAALLGYVWAEKLRSQASGNG